MNKKTLNEYINREVYEDYRNSKKRLNLFDKIWCRYYNPSLNAVYLIRKKQYLESKGKLGLLISKIYYLKLIRRYNIHINRFAKIEIGLRIIHPSCITVAQCEIGKNFTIYQQCTVGAKSRSCIDTPQIGDNVIMYCGSSIIGNCKVHDNVAIGANSLLLTDAEEPGIYVGSPATKK